LAASRSKEFSALQQYIDELTQEKFELQRSVEQQGRLAATLAAENQALTEDFNKQVHGRAQRTQTDGQTDGQTGLGAQGLPLGESTSQRGTPAPALLGRCC
jgi:hypothetical protein